MKRRPILFAVIPFVLVLAGCEQLTPLASLIHEQLQLAPPTMDAPAADANGYSNTDIVVTLNHDDGSVRLYYTTDRSDPGDNGTLYTGPFTLSGHNIPLLVKALARKDLQLDSEVIQSEFLILYDSAQAPVFSPSPGTFNAEVAVDMSSGSGGAFIWYTLDGTDPRGSATRIRYNGVPIDMADDGTPDGSRIVINAVAQVSGLPDSPITTGEYIVLYDTLSMPVLTPATQQSENAFDVTMTSPDGADIWYTTNGTSPISGTGSAAVPSASASRYTAPITINWSGYDSRTLKAACIGTGKRPSPVQIGSYFRQIGQTPTPTVEIYDPGDSLTIPAIGGTVYTNAAAPRARIASPTAGDRFFYTLNGSMPMVSVNGSTIQILNASTYELSGSSALPVPEGSYELNVIAVSPGSDPSQLVTQPVEVDRTAPAAPGAGTTGLTTAPNANIYLNAARWADDAWSMTFTGGGGGNGTFEWRWNGSGTSTSVTANSVTGAALAPTMTGGDGAYTFQVRERDNAGNWSLWTDVTFYRDTLAPTVVTSRYPANFTIGQYLSSLNQYYILFSEPMDPASVQFTVRVYGGAQVGSLVTSDNFRFDIDIPGGLSLDTEYQFSFAGAADMAGNPYAGVSSISRFVTGAVIWSAGNIMYRAPITSRVGYPSPQVWYTGPAGSTITDIEVADYKVFWSEVDSGGEGHLKYANNKQSFAGTVFPVSDVSTGVIRDIEIDVPGQSVYYTSPENTWTIRSQSYISAVGNGEETSASAPNPRNLAWDGSSYYRSDQTFNNFYSPALAYEPAVGIINSPHTVGLEYRLNGGNREFYGLIDLEGGGVAFPPTANASSYVAKTVLNSGMTVEVSSTSSSALNASALWGNGKVYGGDIELVETAGVSRIYVIAPTITGTAVDAAANEYCAVFSMDLNLGNITQHYNPNSLGLTRSLDGAIAIDTE